MPAACQLHLVVLRRLVTQRDLSNTSDAAPSARLPPSNCQLSIEKNTQPPHRMMHTTRATPMKWIGSARFMAPLFAFSIVLLIGSPQPGHAGVFGDTSLPQAGHWINFAGSTMDRLLVS